MEERSGLGAHLWQHIEAGEWDAARALLADDFEAVRPHTGERIDSPDNFVAVMREHADQWRNEVRRVLVDGEQAAVEVARTHVDGGTFYGACFYELAGSTIRRATEYWVAEATEAPAQSHTRWAETYE